MTFLYIIETLIVGIVILTVGVLAKKKWLMTISIIPLVISIVKIIIRWMKINLKYILF